MDNNIEEYFQKSKGEGIDDDNFANPGSGTGFYQGDDFAASIPEFEEPDFTEPYEPELPDIYEPIEYEKPEIDFSEYEIDPIDLTPPEGFTGEFGLGGFNNPNSTNNSNFQLANVGLPGYVNYLSQPDYLVFDTEYYLEQNSEIPSFYASDPFRHFVSFGAAQGKEYRYTIEIDYTPPEQEIISNNEGIAQNYALSGYLGNLESFVTSNGDFLAFDTDYYLWHNPDLTVAGVDPLLHFSEFGLNENREHRYIFVDNLLTYNSTSDVDRTQDSLSTNGGNTNSFNPDSNPYFTFDSQYYLQQNPDVAAAGVDPYEHYISFGQLESRSPNIYHDLFPPSTFGTENINNFDSSNSSFT